MTIPDRQCAPWPSDSHHLELPRASATGSASKKQQRPPTPTTPTTPHWRQGDRGSDDDAAATPRLTVFVRYSDLVAAKIINNYTTLNNLIDFDGFPQGIMLGRNTRAFPLHQVEAWLRSRPTARRSTPHREKQKAAD